MLKLNLFLFSLTCLYSKDLEVDSSVGTLEIFTVVGIIIAILALIFFIIRLVIQFFLKINFIEPDGRTKSGYKVTTLGAFGFISLFVIACGIYLSILPYFTETIV